MKNNSNIQQKIFRYSILMLSIFIITNCSTLADYDCSIGGIYNSFCIKSEYKTKLEQQLDIELSGYQNKIFEKRESYYSIYSPKFSPEYTTLWRSSLQYVLTYLENNKKDTISMLNDNFIAGASAIIDDESTIKMKMTQAGRDQLRRMGLDSSTIKRLNSEVESFSRSISEELVSSINSMVINTISTTYIPSILNKNIVQKGKCFLIYPREKMSPMVDARSGNIYLDYRDIPALSELDLRTIMLHESGHVLLEVREAWESWSIDMNKQFKKLMKAEDKVEGNLLDSFSNVLDKLKLSINSEFMIDKFVISYLSNETNLRYQYKNILLEHIVENDSQSNRIKAIEILNKYVDNGYDIASMDKATIYIAFVLQAALQNQDSIIQTKAIGEKQLKQFFSSEEAYNLYKQYQYLMENSKLKL